MQTLQALTGSTTAIRSLSSIVASDRRNAQSSSTPASSEIRLAQVKLGSREGKLHILWLLVNLFSIAGKFYGQLDLHEHVHTT